MAFDFKEYVNRRKSQKDGKGSRGPARYAYSADRQALAALATMVPVRMAVEAYLRTFKDITKGELLGSAVRVSPRQFPGLFKIAAKCCSTLDTAIPEVFVIQNPVINAYTYGTNDDSFILVHSATVDHLDEAELAFIIGHECGHIQNEHVTYYSLAIDIAKISSVLVSWIVAPVRLALDAWSRRSEITADRAGLLCSRDPEAAKRALIKVALGSHKLYSQVDVDEFLGQVSEIKKTLGRFTELTRSHPYIPKRVKALELFESSVLYDEEGEDALSALELDDKVSRIIKIVA